MKKILFILLLILISISSYSQKVLTTKSFYDSNNNKYIKTVVLNNTNKTISCIVFELEYNYPGRLLGGSECYKEVAIKINIPPRKYKIITYYPPKDKFEARIQRMKRVIFVGGLYKNYF